MYQFNQSNIPAEYLHNALCLRSEIALQIDRDTLSPPVKGMSREQRDSAVRKLMHLLREHLKAHEKGQVGEGESAITSQLQKLQWRKQQAVWSNDWWKNDECWVAPWIDAMRKYLFPISQTTIVLDPIFDFI